MFNGAQLCKVKIKSGKNKIYENKNENYLPFAYALHRDVDNNAKNICAGSIGRVPGVL